MMKKLLNGKYNRKGKIFNVDKKRVKDKCKLESILLNM